MFVCHMNKDSFLQLMLKRKLDFYVWFGKEHKNCLKCEIFWYFFLCWLTVICFQLCLELIINIVVVKVFSISSHFVTLSLLLIETFPEIKINVKFFYKEWSITNLKALVFSLKASKASCFSAIISSSCWAYAVRKIFGVQKIFDIHEYSPSWS